jgi:hypothetical protein
MGLPTNRCLGFLEAARLEPRDAEHVRRGD